MTEITNVAYKKGNWMRYTLWAIVAILLVVVAVLFIKGISSSSTTPVASGYKYFVADTHAEGGVVVTYYIYDNKIYTVTESEGAPRKVFIYDNIDTSKLVYDENSTTEVCNQTECWRDPKVLAQIKQAILHKAGREYNGT